MAKVIYSEEALRDFERIIEFSLGASSGSPGGVVEQIRDAIAMLAEHPLIGRKRDSLRRELVISRGRSGYVAMYRFDPAQDAVPVLRIRHHREAGFSD
ncbi:MAG TPA: type II toxin-antitoxin system RelE/ParE family toxin [Burkholderiales bacterium]|nr:type II toxin-antitoxin system RelE/ParE family toxin [Burkholderiales bacterium]